MSSINRHSGAAPIAEIHKAKGNASSIAHSISTTGTGGSYSESRPGVTPVRRTAGRVLRVAQRRLGSAARQAALALAPGVKAQLVVRLVKLDGLVGHRLEDFI